MLRFVSAVSAVLMLVILARVISLVRKQSTYNILIGELTRLRAKDGLDEDGMSTTFASRIDVNDPFVFRWRVRAVEGPGQLECLKVIRGRPTSYSLGISQQK